MKRRTPRPADAALDQTGGLNFSGETRGSQNTLVHLLVGVGVAMLAVCLPARGADEPSCDIPDAQESPAAGNWTGNFRLTYELLVPQMPPTMKFTVTWQGTLDFFLARPPDREDPPSPPQEHRNRRPLRPPGSSDTADTASTPPSDQARPGQFASDDEQRAAVIAAWERRWQEEEGRASEQAKNFGTVLIHDDHTGEIAGSARARLQMQAGGMLMPGIAASGGGASTQNREYELKASETYPSEGFGEILIIGDPGESGFAGSFAASGVGGRGSADLRVGRDGSVTGRGRGESGSQAVERDINQPGSGSSESGKSTLAALIIEEVECGTLKGQVDASYIRAMMQQSPAGLDIRVIESEWTAVREDRDEAFEQQVSQLVNDPVPSEITWEYLDRYADQFQRLHAEAGNDTYKRCLLVKARHKGITITMAALQALLRHAPTVRQGATAAVLKEWRIRTLPFIHTLSMSGVDECPLIYAADEKFYGEVRELLRKVLASRHTIEDLLQFAPLWDVGQMGDLAQPFLDAWRAIAPNAPAPYVLE